MSFEVSPCYAAMKRLPIKYTWLVHSWPSKEGQSIVQKWESPSFLMNPCVLYRETASRVSLQTEIVFRDHWVSFLQLLQHRKVFHTLII